MNAASHDSATLAPATAPQRATAAAITENGVVAGLIGALVVAVGFFILDVVRGQPFHTPSLLGSVLFLGAKVDEATAVSGIIVFAYTGVHLLLFLVAGVVLAWTIAQVETYPQFGLLLVLLLVLAEAITFGFEAAIVPRLVGALGAWAVALANVASAAAMIWFLLRRHPGAVERLRAAWNGN
jgi:hypothetical protein